MFGAEDQVDWSAVQSSTRREEAVSGFQGFSFGEAWLASRKERMEDRSLAVGMNGKVFLGL